MVGTLYTQDNKWIIQRLNGEIYPLHQDDYRDVSKLLSTSVTHVEFRFKSDRYGIVVYGYIEKKIEQSEFREHVLKQLI